MIHNAVHIRRGASAWLRSAASGVSFRLLGGVVLLGLCATVILIASLTAQAAFNPEINYQGNLYQKHDRRGLH
jgi:hypothetical protein